MPYLETPDELADHIADLAGVYGACDKEPDCRECNCRIGFVEEMAERIRNAVANEQRLEQTVAGSKQHGD